LSALMQGYGSGLNHYIVTENLKKLSKTIIR
jgi:hypothetical protein